MTQKDYFSGHSKAYAVFRPSYPKELYNFIFGYVKNFDRAWDCATGNGQVAHYLAPHFKEVLATDISKPQLDNAHKASNIFYSVAPAEKTTITGSSIDLITVAQAFHWFSVEEFYTEVRRVIRPGGLLAIWGYNVLSISPEIDVIIQDFYINTTGPYWDERRKLVDEEYKTIPFPFKQIALPRINMILYWTLEHLTGYLSTWSATQKFIQVNNVNPIPDLTERLKKAWPQDAIKPVIFPVFGKLGRAN